MPCHRATLCGWPVLLSWLGRGLGQPAAAVAGFGVVTCRPGRQDWVGRCGPVTVPARQPNLARPRLNPRLPYPWAPFLRTSISTAWRAVLFRLQLRSSEGCQARAPPLQLLAAYSVPCSAAGPHGVGTCTTPRCEGHALPQKASLALPGKQEGKHYSCCGALQGACGGQQACQTTVGRVVSVAVSTPRAAHRVLSTRHVAPGLGSNLPCL